MRDMIEFDADKVRRLRSAYDSAVADNREAFTFEGHDFLVDYAKYLLEYLEKRFP